MKGQRIQFKLGRFSSLITLWILLAAGVTIGEAGLQIYLLPEPVVESEIITLGQVGIIRGDEALAEKVRAISLGRLVMVGQQIVLDRPTIFSRLASFGVATNSVALCGAEKVIVRRNEQNLAGDRLTMVGMALLKGLNPAPSKIVLVRPPVPLVLEAGANPELKPRLVGPIRGGLARVCVEAIDKGKVIAQQDIIFGIKYLRHRIVANEDLASGVQITSGNVTVVTVEANEPEPAGWAAPYGMLTRQRVTKGMEVDIQRLSPVEIPIVVRRRQTVVVKLETGRLFISSLGEAQADGKVGEFIPVKMGSDKDSRVIKARIRPDGTLEPYYEGIHL